MKKPFNHSLRFFERNKPILPSPPPIKQSLLTTSNIFTQHLPTDQTQHPTPSLTPPPIVTPEPTNTRAKRYNALPSPSLSLSFVHSGAFESLESGIAIKLDRRRIERRARERGRRRRRRRAFLLARNFQESHSWRERGTIETEEEEEEAERRSIERERRSFHTWAPRSVGGRRVQLVLQSSPLAGCSLSGGGGGRMTARRDGDGGWKKGEKLERRMWLNSFGPFMARMKRPRRTDIGEKRRELLWLLLLTFL